MILDLLENSGYYSAQNPGLELAFDFLRKHSESPFPAGRYDLDGDNVYAMVSGYETQPYENIAYESHRSYIDVQYVRSGREYLYWALMDDSTVKVPYDEKGDVCFFPDMEGTALPLDKGSFIVLYPEDIHKPRCIAGCPTQVEKVVIKVRL
ncbi:MAG: YhcH/YjgK/YiaL family protein [Oscillospiraceae bacterium]|nr:YhcH/YjgK/YiaL family protein [Oscillospiraceae bacterium]